MLHTNLIILVVLIASANGSLLGGGGCGGGVVPLPVAGRMLSGRHQPLEFFLRRGRALQATTSDVSTHGVIATAGMSSQDHTAASTNKRL